MPAIAISPAPPRFDLGRAVGSRRWFGELALLVALTGGALALWPRGWVPANAVRGYPGRHAGANPAAPATPRTAPRRLRGRAGTDLYRALLASGASVAVAQAYLAAIDAALGFGWRAAPGDVFDLVVAPGTPALAYAALDRDGVARAELVRWGGGLVAVSPAAAIALLPVDARVTSGYGLRLHPLLGIVRLHAGTDYGAAAGTPIRATDDGVVAYAGPRGGLGRYVRIDQADGTGSGYGHMSRIAVAAGAPVLAGEVIGYVGATGLATGPHLHYEVYRHGRPVDPRGAAMAAPVPQLAPAQLAGFAARLRELRAVQAG